MRILLVEDDRMIGEAVQAALREAAYAVDWVRDGQTALDATAAQHYDMVLLDLGLPGRDGSEVLATLRRNHNPIPVLIITARDSIQDRIQGLDNGADDYLPKPFELEELLARMRAVLRRQSGSAQPLLTSGSLALDPATHEARFQDQAPVALSNREFALLQALMTQPGVILSRSELEDRVYGWGQEVESNAIEFIIHGLRRKLGRDAIKNVRGAGWMVPRNA